SFSSPNANATPTTPFPLRPILQPPKTQSKEPSSLDILSGIESNGKQNDPSRGKQSRRLGLGRNRLVKDSAASGKHENPSSLMIHGPSPGDENDSHLADALM